MFKYLIFSDAKNKEDTFLKFVFNASKDVKLRRRKKFVRKDENYYFWSSGLGGWGDISTKVNVETYQILHFTLLILLGLNVLGLRTRPSSFVTSEVK